MDYMVGGDFLGLLMRRCILPEDIAKWYVAEMILCIEEAHKLCWIHRDVKPDNFLISASGHLKISDFGLAFDGHWAHDQVYYNDHRYSLVRRLGIQVDGDIEDQQGNKTKNPEQSSLNTGDKGITLMPPSTNLLEWRDQNQMRRLARSVVGTSQYMAPEVVRAHFYDGRCDWWSVGVILYEVRLPAFQGLSSIDVVNTNYPVLVRLYTICFTGQGQDQVEDSCRLCIRHWRKQHVTDGSSSITFRHCIFQYKDRQINLFHRRPLTSSTACSRKRNTGFHVMLTGRMISSTHDQ
jgi:serine/threonine protein kinase